MQQFARRALLWREPYREYGFVGWLFIAGAVWLGVGVSARVEPPLSALWGCYLLLLLVAVCAIDARFGIIPDSLLVWLGAGGLLQLVGQSWDVTGERLAAGLVAFLLGGLLRIVYQALRGREGLGYGDVKFLLAGAPWIGLEGLPFFLLVAVSSASLALVILRIDGTRFTRSDALSFGPHLAVALWLVWTGRELFQP